jgi:acyl carrier protein
VLRVIAKVERRYGVELEDEEVFGVTCIDEVAQIVERIRADGRLDATP